METAEESWKEHLATEEKKYVSWKKNHTLLNSDVPDFPWMIVMFLL